MGSVYSAAKYLAEAGVAWDIPESKGAYPIFAAHATENDTKRTMSAHIKQEKGTKTTKSCKRLLINQLLANVNNDYLLQLKDGMREYQGQTLRELLAHLKKYDKIDNVVHQRIMEGIRRAPNIDLPIDKYFAKQRECKSNLRTRTTPSRTPRWSSNWPSILARYPGSGGMSSSSKRGTRTNVREP